MGGVRVLALPRRRRPKNLRVPPLFPFYLWPVLLARPLVVLGPIFGGRDHSTVIHSVQKVEGELEGDARLKERIDDVRRELLA
jgi:chromosomal replication initiator protein